MARLQVEIDGNASGLTKSFGISSRSVDQLEKEIKDLQKTLKNELDEKSIAKINGKIKEAQSELKRINGLSLNPISNQFNNLGASAGVANGAAIEVGRVIQDLPYAANNFGSIGNNITRITEQFGMLHQQTGSVSASFKALGASLISSGNLISLAFSAAITGWTLWQQHSAKAQKATKDLEDGTKTYIETLEGLQRASADGQNNAQKDLTNLKLLYDATQNLTVPMDKRKKVAEELIKQYPKQFEGLTTEALLAGKAADAYNKLTASITATAMAAAYANKMTENAQKQLNNYLQIIDKQNQANKLSLQIEKQKASISTSAAGSAGTGASSAAQYSLVANLEEKRTKVLAEVNKLGTENFNITNENTLLQKNYNDQIIKGADASGKLNTSLDKTKKKTKDMTDGLIEQLQGGLMSEFDRKLFEIGNRYDEIRKKISEIGDAGKRDNAFGLARQLELIEKLKVETERFIYMTQGLKSMNTISPNLTTNSAVLPGREAAIKRFNTPIVSGKSKEEKDLEKRLGRIVERGFRNGISDIAGNITDLGSDFKEVFTNVFNSLAGSVGRMFQDVLATQLGDKFAKMINSDDFKIGKLSSNMSKGILAGAGIAGSLISGMSKKTSTVGQAAGGALSGAAAGMAFGPYGAAVGAIVGAISGIFSASSAKKQEKLQEQQLAEQRKQTAIMERQNSLAWAANIIGQMTSNGMVNSIDRSATGELVAKVSGQDLLFVLNRAGGKR